MYPAVGGDLPRWIYPVVVADELEVNPNAKAEEAWGWLPPTLIGEGRKVQTQWLHDFLLNPYPIRPAVVLRMPKFNMSSDEASKLAHYFAARDGAEYPFEFDSRQQADYLAAADQGHPSRLADALKIITDNNYCVKCHLLGEYSPGGNPKALGPQLADVHRRLRPDYVHPWIANPKRFLPYTGMPVNIPPDKPVDQKLFPGDSEEQLSGVTDFLMNFDRYTKQQFKPDIKPPPPADEAAAAETSANAEEN
jgi:hypothetical protein